MSPSPADPTPADAPKPPEMCGNLPLGAPPDIDAARNGIAPRSFDPAAVAEERQAGTNKWNKSVLVVGFLQTAQNAFVAKIRNAVMAIAPEWSQFANIDFQFQEGGQNADITINFAGQPRQVNSQLGSASRWYADNGQASMNLVFHGQDTDSYIRAIILHEFGHALGLIHEHQMPPSMNPIQWDQSVYQNYSAAYQGQVDSNYIKTQILDPYAGQLTHWQAFDPQSIMLYPIPAGCAWINGQQFVVGQVTQLSAGDKAFIANMYPGRGGGGGGGGGDATSPPPPPFEHPSKELTLGEEKKDFLDAQGQARTYSFVLAANQWLRFRTTGDGEKKVRVLGPDSETTEFEKLLAKGDGNVDTKRNYDPGTYYLEVTMPVGTGPYTVAVSATSE